MALELRANVGDVGKVGDVDLRGERPAPREDRDQVLEREALDRLADRRAPDLELAAERVLVDRRAGGDPQGDDPVAELGISAIGEQLAGLSLRHLHVGNDSSPAATARRVVRRCLQPKTARN